jgi:hypothetical protein
MAMASDRAMAKPSTPAGHSTGVLIRPCERYLRASCTFGSLRAWRSDGDPLEIEPSARFRPSSKSMTTRSLRTTAGRPGGCLPCGGP